MLASLPIRASDVEVIPKQIYCIECIGLAIC